jgi:hypothetical protein
MAEHLKPMMLRQPGQIGDDFGNECRDFVRFAIVVCGSARGCLFMSMGAGFRPWLFILVKIESGIVPSFTMQL